MTERLKLLNSYVNKLKRRETINKRNDDLYPFINGFAESRQFKTNIPKVNIDEKMIQDIKFKKSSRKIKEFPQDLIRKMIESNDISSIQLCLKSFPKFFVFPLSSDYTPFVNDFDTLKFLVDNQIISKLNIKNCRCLYMNFDKRYFQFLFENNENNLGKLKKFAGNLKKLPNITFSHLIIFGSNHLRNSKIYSKTILH